MQKRRNAIHLWDRRELGTWVEFDAAVREYFKFVLRIDLQIPYP